MDISTQNWLHGIHKLLDDISNALFVAIDFEISGISLKSSSDKTQDYQQQTLQQRYERVKAAAEKYQILQVGITTAVEDGTNGGYVLRPYNIYLNPLIRAKLPIDREFSMQSSSMAFLQGHGFNIQTPFRRGVPYLSHHEESLARAEQNKISDGVVDTEFFAKIFDPTQRAIVSRMREIISGWLDLQEKPPFLNLGPDVYDSSRQFLGGFDPIERQLIHGLVKAEFPKLGCIDLPGYIRLDIRNVYKEAAVTAENLELLEEKLQQQIGLRWVFDGMISSHGLDKIDILSYFSEETFPKDPVDQHNTLRQFETIKTKLRKPTVLVGHNVFTDLVNFYACFIGPLPAKVEDFQAQIHTFFPMVIDTKYLALQSGNTGGFRSSLTELDSSVKDMPLPKVSCHAHHTKYSTEEGLSHEAGFDSYITARTMIKLAAKLDALGCYHDEPDNKPESSHDILIDLDEDPIIESSVDELAAAFGIDLNAGSSTTESDTLKDDKEIPEYIPGFDTKFWRIYGNRLMVNGTVRSLCQL